MNRNLMFSCFMLASVLLLSARVTAQQVASPDAVFATIDETVITEVEYQRIFRAAVRNRYYHGKVPKPELARFQREVGRDVVNQFLVHKEALRQGMTPDTEQIQSGIAEYDARYAEQPGWQEQRERQIPAMLIQLERRDLLLQMEEKVKDVPQPSATEVEAYFQQHPEKFTEPERKHVSIILLRVQPSAGGAAWEEAAGRAAALRFQLIEGADFGELAKANSQDFSAPSGGDLGFLHSGMLADEAETALAPLAVGEITEPIAMLEGVALFRLNDRTPATLQSFADVQQRAVALLHRERQDRAWEAYLQTLRSNATIELNETLYMPLADAGATQ